jgi:lipopolysaccharide/colanic/teichoic acid biosynthesis glycosyltransferase
MTAQNTLARPVPYDRAKRVLDALLASVLLALSTPIGAVIAVAIRLDDGGPVLLRQTRIGRGGRPFGCWKFRTMHVDADDGAHRRLMAAMIAGTARPVSDASNRPVYRIVADARVTRVGRFLRRTSLDELPQLWNVVCGDMSLVGPRPPLDWEVARYGPHHLARLAIRPGITGLWQTTAWDRATFDEMVELDRRYIDTRSLWVDARILARTVAVLPRRWAAR